MSVTLRLLLEVTPTFCASDLSSTLCLFYGPWGILPLHSALQSTVVFNHSHYLSAFTLPLLGAAANEFPTSSLMRF
ncbi:hypothetical protein C8R47DRAFT_41471 [Mycena vitilis]|nr:hypothetical protein C8R47DRAFT_41471 [Mycena vitilis]